MKLKEAVVKVAEGRWFCIGEHRNLKLWIDGCSTHDLRVTGDAAELLGDERDYSTKFKKRVTAALVRLLPQVKAFAILKRALNQSFSITISRAKSGLQELWPTFETIKVGRHRINDLVFAYVAGELLTGITTIQVEDSNLGRSK